MGTLDTNITGVAASVPGGGGNYLQSVDYRYHIRGWLKSINNSQLSNDSGATNDDTNDYFGMELAYNSAAGMSNTLYYNGNISAIKWKTYGQASGTTGQKSYKYSYDKSDKLKLASYQGYGTSSWNKDVNTLNEGMGYDHNGNIQKLARKHNPAGLGTAAFVDSLAYTYASGNQMSKVEDVISTSVGTGDFKNGATNTTEYTYNSDGAMTKDDNKGISAIAYNDLGKVSSVTFTDGRSITYKYDAAGNKLTVKNFASGPTLIDSTNYAGSFVYVNSSLKFFSSPEGRVIKNGNAMEYQYAIADHQGNTRVLFTTAAPAPLVAAATMEVSPNGAFLNSTTNRVNVELWDHTDVSNDGTDYSQKLTGASGQQVGIAKTIHVYPGDTVKIEAYSKYFSTGGTSNLTGFATALLSAFGLSTPAGGEVGTPASGVSGWGGIVAGGNGKTNTGYPKAFVNLLIFDKNYNYLDLGYDGINGGEQTSDPAKAPHDYMMQKYVIKEEGYVYAYVSNENPTLVEVYFDDVKVTHVPSKLIQTNEYYPFGMQTANSWTRENAIGNNFLYSGQEKASDLDSYQFDERLLNFQLGRWGSVDPLAEKYPESSPYTYVLGNPVVNVDVKGMWTVPVHYSMTWTALYNVGGIDGKQMEALSRYASVYADHPTKTILFVSNFMPSGDYAVSFMMYRSNIDYSKTASSQIMDWSPDIGHDNYNVWHVMKSSWEEQHGVSNDAAMERGLQFAWTNIFDAAKSKIPLKYLKENSDEMEMWGQGMHALQDAYAHRGSTWQDLFGITDFSHLWNDMKNIEDMKRAEQATDAAITVYKLLSGDFEGLNSDRIGIMFGNAGSGMTRKQLDEVIAAAMAWLSAN